MTRAIILAGGFGTRLKSAIGGDIPKPMAPVAGEPFLAHYLRYLRRQGVTDVMLSVHHLRHTIMDYFGASFEGMPISYAIEEEPLGTGGAVRYALSLMKPAVPVLVANGDSFVELDIRAMMNSHRDSGSKLTIALCKMPGCSRYGEVAFDESRTITSFTYPGGEGPGWISTGIYAVSPSLFAGCDLPANFSFEADFQRPLVGLVKPHAWLAQGYFIDIGVPEDYARAQHDLAQLIPAG